MSPNTEQKISFATFLLYLNFIHSKSIYNISFLLSINKISNFLLYFHDLVVLPFGFYYCFLKNGFYVINEE